MVEAIIWNYYKLYFLVHYMCPWQLLSWIIEAHDTDVSIGVLWWVEKPCYRRITLLVVDGTRTQVIADNFAIAASETTLSAITITIN